MMTRKSQDFAPGMFQLSLSPEQLTQLLGKELSDQVSDQYCRVDPADQNQLDLWILLKGNEYIHTPVAKPTDWKVFTIEATYYDNGQEYTQSVLATDETDAEKVVQAVAYFSNTGALAEGEEVEESLDIDSITPGVPRSTNTNSSNYPKQICYLTAFVASSKEYAKLFTDEDGPFGDEPVGEGFTRLSEAVVAFFNELTPTEREYLQDAGAYRFLDSFIAQNQPVA